MLLVAVGVLALLLFILIKYQYSYWQRLGVPCISPSFPFGNMQDSFKQLRHLGDIYEEFYVTFRKTSDKGFGGIYAMFRPVFVPVDPDLVKCIMLKDFNHFVDRGMYMNEKKDPITAHLFNLRGQRWRTLRQKLTPTFTSGKLKYMFQTLVDCSQGLAPIMEQYRNEPIDIKDVVARYTTDVIGSCAFGIDCNSLKDPKSYFRVYGKRTFERTRFEAFKRFFILAFPNLMLKLNFRGESPEVSKFFTGITKETVEYREKNNVVRKDFMNLLLQLKNAGKMDENQGPMREMFKVQEELTLEQIVAQCFVFFLGGFETSSTTLTFLLFELTQNVDVQEKLRNEVRSVLKKHQGQITYDSMMDMKYMDMCIDETLRKYPPLPVLNRVCTKDYPIPGTDIVLKKDTHVHIPIKGLQYDPEYYPEPESFDPERFTEENKKTRPDYTHLPFGEGPRICIGLRFGMMQTKVGLAALIKDFKFTLSEKTQLPLKIHPRNSITTAVGDVWLKAEKI